MDSIIVCENLSLAYEKKIIIQNLNMNIYDGDYLCILGENGSGKSTLLKGLLNLKKPLSGNIYFDKDVTLKDIGYLSQQNNIQKDFPASIYEIVLSGCLNRLGSRFFYGKSEKSRATYYMKLLGIENISKKAYNELSGGQRQRVLLARALCSGDRILVLDEPVAGLDPLITEEFYNLIHKLNIEENITIIMVSHDIAYVLKYAKHILHLSHDNYYGTVDEYKKSDLYKKFIMI